MAYSATVTKNITLAGKNYAQQLTITQPHFEGLEESLAVAKTGTLTTRTDNNTGTLTMDTGHGITTGAKIDLYWTNSDGTTGIQYAITVGTVSVNSVPFDLGVGDNLPIAATAIRASVIQVYTLEFTADDLAVLVGAADNTPCVITFLDTGGTVIQLAAPLQTSEIYEWAGESTNPLAGVDVDTVHMTQGGTTAAAAVRVGALLTV